MGEYSFKSLIGNTYTKTLIARTLESGTFSPFTILEGIYGTGKSTTAKIAALRLTCESPNGSEPCLVCNSCKNNIKAFETTGQSTCVKVVNLGKFENKTEINDLIKDVFVLHSGEKSMVYIFEEVHVLKNLKGAQTAFLEELDRLAANTYIIMCTTRGYDVIPELSSRAIVFKFNRLNENESMALVTREAAGRLDRTIMNLVAKYSKGIPRNICKSVEFIIANSVSEDEYREFIQDVSDESLCTIFLTMKDKNLSSFIGMTKELLEQRDPQTIFLALKEILLKVLFYKEQVSVDLSPYCTAIVDDVFNNKNINQCLGLVDKCSEKLSETDLMFLFYKIRLAVQDRGVKEVFSESSRVASVVNEEVMNQRKFENLDMNKKGLTPIDVTKIKSF